MKTAKDERKAIDSKKGFPNKRVEEMFWAYADEILDMDKDVKHRDIYAMLETAFKEMGSIVLSDLKLIDRGLPPRLCKKALKETVSHIKSKPVNIN